MLACMLAHTPLHIHILAGTHKHLLEHTNLYAHKHTDRRMRKNAHTYAFTRKCTHACAHAACAHAACGAVPDLLLS